MARKTEKPQRSPMSMAVGIRSGPQWKAWLDEFADFCRVGKVAVIDTALEEYALKRGFRRPPKREE